MTNIMSISTILDRRERDLSVIIAVRNEEGYIHRCLDSLIDQDLPHDKYEIIVIDGLSDDKTAELVDIYQRKFPNLVRACDNPKRIQAAGRNIGIKIAKSKVVLIFSGHVYADSQFLSTLIKALNSAPNLVAGVGGIHIPPEDESFFGKAMSDVQMSFLGGGGTSYRQHHKLTYVDTVAFCAYKKNIVESVGLHDENFDKGEDFELNYRIRKAGFKLMVCPQAISYYYRKHRSLKSFLQLMISYGIWRTLVTKKHPDSFKIQFAMPIIIISALAFLPVMMLLSPLLADVIFTGLTLYLIAILTSSLHLCIKRRNIKYLIAVPLYAVEHFGIGLGLIAGLFRKSQRKYSGGID